MEKLKVLSLFSSIGAFEKALEREKIPHEVVAYGEIDKCSNVGMSNTQLYKQAGNSIVVNVLQAIFRTLF